MEALLPRKLAGRECQSLANKYQCQSAILEIMACDMFLQKKLSHAKLRMIQLDSAKVNDGNAVTAEKSKVSDPQDPTSVVSTWCQGSVLESLVKTYASCGYDGEIWFRLKVCSTLIDIGALSSHYVVIFFLYCLDVLLLSFLSFKVHSPHFLL